MGWSREGDMEPGRNSGDRKCDSTQECAKPCEAIACGELATMAQSVQPAFKILVFTHSTMRDQEPDGT